MHLHCNREVPSMTVGSCRLYRHVARATRIRCGTVRYATLRRRFVGLTLIALLIHLKEPIHSGEYLASQLYAVTDDMGITDAIFTCTRDNASANTVMLAEYERLASNHSTSTQQPWTFTVKEGDVRCIAHIINIAVQHALKTIKADPSAEAETYRCELGAARIPRTVDSHTEVMNTLVKLRRHIYVFRNRRLWKEALQKQTMVAGLKVQQLSLDMPVRWNSTHKMLESAIKLQVPITAICASQQWDISMRDIALNANDWSTIKELELFFVIFLRPSQKLQASTYPTLNYAIPQYLKMINKLNHMLKEVGEQSTIGIACNAALYKLNEYYTLVAVHETDSDDDLYATQGISFQEPEWKRWILELRPGQQTDILKYWLSKQYMYPIVAQIARDYLAIPATSAASEQVFINGSNIITKKRNRLSPSTVRYLLCLRDWGVLPEGDDSEGDGDDEWEE